MEMAGPRGRVTPTRLLLLIVVCLAAFSAAVPIHPTDAELLLQVLGNFTDLPSGWHPNNVTNACSWPGIMCYNDGHINRIDQEGVNANTTIPTALALFPRLETLALANCNLFGTIPPEIFTNLPLIYFRVSNNDLNGAIPSTVLQATSLRNFQVETNRLTGTVPAGMENLPQLRDLSIYRNRLSCPFPLALYNVLAERNASFCLMNGNLWDSAFNGKLCNSDILRDPHRSACTIGPFPASSNGKIGTGDYHFESESNRFEIRGSELFVFAKLRNGSAFRDEYVSMRIYSINLYEEIAPATLGKPPSVRNWFALPLNGFSNFTQISPGVYELSAYFTNAPIHTFTLIVYANYDSANGGAKVSWKALGNDIFRSRNGTRGFVGFPLHYEVRGGLLNSSSVLRCPESSFSLNCSTNRFETVSVAHPLDLSWSYRSEKTQFAFDIPYQTMTDEATSSAFMRRKSLYMRGYGPMTFLYDQRVWDFFQPAEQEQGLYYMLEMITGPARNAVYYDPTFSLRILFDDSATPPSSTPAAVSRAEESAPVNLAVAVAVSLVVVAVISIIAVIALVPAVRRKVFGFESALHAAKKRQTDHTRRAVVEPSPTSAQRDMTRSSSSWRTASPSVTAPDARNSLD